MKYIRYEHNEEVRFGELEKGVVYELDGDYISGAKRTGVGLPLNEVRLLAPCIPGKIVGVTANYRSFLDAKKIPYPRIPKLFQKPKTSVIASGETIRLPDPAHVVNYEGELAVVIGTRCTKVKLEDAMDYVFGCTCINDVSDVTMCDEDQTLGRGKGCDTFSPIGPLVSDEIDPENVMIETRLNGKVVQHENSSDIYFSIPELIEFISAYMTLEPGDIIASGTPVGAARLHPGDRIEVEVEGIGSIWNRVE